MEDGGRVTVERDIEIHAAPDAVWALVGRFDDMSWHPSVHATEAPEEAGPGTERLLTLGEAGGPTIREALVERSDAARRYAYRILEVDPAVLPLANYRSEIAVVAEPAGGGCLLRWKCRFDPAAGSTEAQAAAVIGGVYAAGLAAAKRALESG